ncbi:MAG: hypothetical protein ACFE9Z_13385 [Promethearchaeota archaeon]
MKKTNRNKVKKAIEEKVIFTKSNIIKIEKEFDPTIIPYNMRWEVRDLSFWLNLGRKKSKN